MRAEEIVKMLSNVKNPFTNVDIVSEGLVTKVITDEEKTIIYVAFARNTPPTPFSMAVNWPIQVKIIKEIAEVLEQKLKLGYFEIVDDMTLQRYYPVEEV